MSADNTHADSTHPAMLQVSGHTSEIARLRQINDWYEKALAFANIGLYRWESATDKWFWSDKVFEIRGFAKDERFVNPVDFYARVHPDDRAWLLAAEIACKNGTAPLNVEYRFVLPSGEVRWHRELADRIVHEDAGNESLFGALIDITEHKRTELELARDRDHLERLIDDRTIALRIAKEAAESAYRAKNMFVANVSHELRTPLNAIMGMTDLTLRKVEDPKLQGYLGKSRQASRRLLSLINDLIDIADIEAERIVLAREAFDPMDIGHAVEQVIRPIATHKGLDFRVDVAPHLAGRTLFGDAARIAHVLKNLADNAVKFTETGHVTVRLGSGRESTDGIMLRGEVEDSGIGIPETDRERIFTLFEQGDGSSTRRYSGTGLGLALSRKLVNLMGGEISVQSRLGAGSSFVFTVRVDAGPAPT